MRNIFGYPYMIELGLKIGDVRRIVDGRCRNSKWRSEFGLLLDMHTVPTRFPQGRPSGAGVRDDVCPVAADLLYVDRRTPLGPARANFVYCRNRANRLQGQFYAC